MTFKIGLLKIEKELSFLQRDNFYLAGLLQEEYYSIGRMTFIIFEKKYLSIVCLLDLKIILHEKVPYKNIFNVLNKKNKITFNYKKGKKEETCSFINGKPKLEKETMNEIRDLLKNYSEIKFKRLTKKISSKELRTITEKEAMKKYLFIIGSIFSPIIIISFIFNGFSQKTLLAIGVAVSILFFGYFLVKILLKP